MTEYLLVTTLTRCTRTASHTICNHRLSDRVQERKRFRMDAILVEMPSCLHYNLICRMSSADHVSLRRRGCFTLRYYNPLLCVTIDVPEILLVDGLIPPNKFWLSNAPGPQLLRHFDGYRTNKWTHVPYTAGPSLARSFLVTLKATFIMLLPFACYLTLWRKLVFEDQSEFSSHSTLSHLCDYSKIRLLE